MPIKWTPERDQTVYCPTCSSHLLLLLTIQPSSSYSRSSRRPKSAPTSPKSPKPGVRDYKTALRYEHTNTVPAATEEAPTPRAIQERLHKIRAMAGGKGSGTFKMSGTVGSRGSAKSSPAKPSTPRKNTVNVEGAAANKRKRASENEYVHNLSLI